MAEVQQKDRGGKKKGKQKKMTIHVDFTPMVDMNMLLICFFMLATSMSKPQRMDIAMPTNDKTITEEEKNVIADSRAVTVLLGENNELYYYTGQADYDTYGNLVETNYDATGLRAFLLSKNRDVVDKIAELKLQRANLEITEEAYNEESKKVKEESKTMPIVVIKPSEASSYENLVDVLDEMLICSISKYAIVDIDQEDLNMIEYFKTGGVSTPSQETN